MNKFFFILLIWLFSCASPAEQAHERATKNAQLIHSLTSHGFKEVTMTNHRDWDCPAGHNTWHMEAYGFKAKNVLNESVEGILCCREGYCLVEF